MDDHAIRSGHAACWFSRAAWAAEEARRAIGFHVTMRLANDGAIARTPGALRYGSRIVLQHGEQRGLIAHRFADTHLHAVLLCTRVEAGTFACVTEGALRKRLRIGAPFQPCRVRPIESERHLGHAVAYLFRQESHHGSGFDLLHDGSSLLDLLGMRLGAPWLLPRVRAALPRLRRGPLLALLEARDLDDEPVELRYLADAAAAAWGVAELRGNLIQHIRARRVAVHMLDRLAPRAGSATIGVPARSAGRYRREDVTAAELRAVDLQIKLRGLLARRRASGDAELL